MKRDPIGVGFQRLLEDFLRLHITAIGQINVGLRDRIHIAGVIELTGRIHHRRGSGCSFTGVDTLSAIGGEQGVVLNTAFEVGAISLGGFLALPDPVKPQAREQEDQTDCARRHQRIFSQFIEQVGLRRDHQGGGGWGHRSGDNRCRGRRHRGRDDAGADRRGDRGRTGCGRHSDRRRGARRRAQCSEFTDVFGNFCRPTRRLFCIAFVGELVFRRLALGRSFGQGELVRRGRRRLLVFNLGLYAAAGCAPGAGHLGARCPVCELSTELVEILALGNNDLRGFAGRRCLDLFGRGQIQDCAGPHAIDVIAAKCSRVGAQQGHQHLIEGHVDGFCRQGNFAGRVAGFDGDLSAWRRGGAGGRPNVALTRLCRLRRGRRRQCGSLGRWAADGCRGRRDLRRGRLGCLFQTGRVKQQRVVANNAPRRPIGLQNHIDERLVDGLIAAQSEIVAPVIAFLQ